MVVVHLVIRHSSVSWFFMFFSPLYWASPFCSKSVLILCNRLILSMPQIPHLFWGAFFLFLFFSFDCQEFLCWFVWSSYSNFKLSNSVIAGFLPRGTMGGDFMTNLNIALSSLLVSKLNSSLHFCSVIRLMLVCILFFFNVAISLMWYLSYVGWRFIH